MAEGRFFREDGWFETDFGYHVRWGIKPPEDPWADWEHSAWFSKRDDAEDFVKVLKDLGVKISREFKED